MRAGGYSSYVSSVLRVTALLGLMLAACTTRAGERDGGVHDAGSDMSSDEDASTPMDGAPPDLAPTPGDEFVGPERLSETSLYADLAAGTIADGVMPYEVRFELWSDGATKRRWLALPAGSRIDTQDPDRWVFPIGTRAWKEFTVGGVRVETRYLVKVAERRWENVAYLWRVDGADADARPEGALDAGGTPHDVPSIGGCFDCHRGAPDGLIGVGALQLATGAPDELLAQLESAGLLSDAIVPRPSIPGTPAEQSALGYLHANCGHCHSDVHPLGRFRTMRLGLPLGLVDPRDAPAFTTTVGVAMGHAVGVTTLGVVAGDPAASQLWARMQLRGDPYQMPARGSEIADPEGIALVRTWIEGLASPPP